jgi:thioredoxin reductase (NADPH)
MGDKNKRHAHVLILGAGPAGYTAAVYAARANLKPVLIAGPEPGGQLMITTDVENYPGYPKGIGGPEMMQDFMQQAERFGTEIVYDVAIKCDLSHRNLEVECEDVVFTCDALIIATGASARYLGLDNEQRLMNKGVSACATCDGAFFREQDVAVVGGGDTAMEEAQYLTRMCRHVHVIHRRDEFRASAIMQQRTLENPKITVLWNRIVSDIKGDDGVTGVELEDTKHGSKEHLDVTGVFIAIGHDPNTKIFAGQLATDDAGYLKVNGDSTATEIPGVFAAGDVADRIYRQAVTAAGTGCMAAIDAERYLAEQAHK